MIPSDIERRDELLDVAHQENLHILDRLEARAELIELAMDYNNSKEARHHLRKLQREIWDETEGR